MAEIISLQAQLLRDYRSALRSFKASSLLDPDELEYIQQVYARLIERSANNLSDLTTVMTGGTLRMSDEERISEIDRIYLDQQDQDNFLRIFNNKNSLLLLQRSKDQEDGKGLHRLYDFK